MADPVFIARLYASVLEEKMIRYKLGHQDIRVGIQNMKDVYKPKPESTQSVFLDIADYNDASHRIAYLHKYAPFHTAMVVEMLGRAIELNKNLYRNLVSTPLNICSLGGGPGNDIVAVLFVLNAYFGYFQAHASIVDIMLQWKSTFSCILEELRYGPYGALGEQMSDQYLTWSYTAANLIGTMSEEVHKAVTSANLVTMIKFVSAASCKDTPAMIKKIFRSMRPGALVLYIDNAGGGFHQLVKREAQECSLQTVFGPLKHELYQNKELAHKRFGYTPCCETTVTVEIWMKTHSDQISNALLINHEPYYINHAAFPHMPINTNISIVDQPIGTNQRNARPNWQQPMIHQGNALQNWQQPMINHGNAPRNWQQPMNNNQRNASRNRQSRSRSRSRNRNRNYRQAYVPNGHNNAADSETSSETFRDPSEDTGCCIIL